MFSISSNILYQFDSLIRSLPSDPCFKDLIFNPDKNFTRTSKLGFINTARFILGTGPTILKNELLSFYDSQSDSVTPSEVVQSRSKIKPDLFQHLFFLFNKTFSCEDNFKVYHLITIFVSKLNIPYNPKDLPSLHKGKSNADGIFW